jgi:hypothetical protein
VSSCKSRDESTKNTLLLSTRFDELQFFINPEIRFQSLSSTQIFHHGPRKSFHPILNQEALSQRRRPGSIYPFSCRSKKPKRHIHHLSVPMNKYESFIASLSTGRRDVYHTCLSRKAWYRSFVIVRWRTSRREFESSLMFSETRSKTWNTCLWGLNAVFRIFPRGWNESQDMTITFEIFTVRAQPSLSTCCSRWNTPRRKDPLCST